MVKFKEYIPILFLILLVVVSFFIIKPFLVAVLLGAILAYGVYPLYKLLLKRIDNKNMVALIVILLVLLILIVPSIFFLNTLIKESYVVYITVKQKLAVGLFEDCTHSLCRRVEDFSQNSEIQYQIQELTKKITSWVIEKGSSFLLSVPRIVLNLFVILFTSFYFMRDGPVFIEKVNTYLSMRQQRYQYIIKRLKEIVHGIIYGYFLIAFIQGSLGALGFFIFGVSSPLFWGLVMAFFSLIPFLGTGIVWVPASLMLLLNGLFQNSNWLVFKGLSLFIYSFIFVSSTDNFLRPKFVSEKAKIHPAILLVGFLGGIVVFGPLGVILGALILAVTVVVIESFFKHDH